MGRYINIVLGSIALASASAAAAEIRLTVNKYENSITIEQDGVIVDKRPVAVGQIGDETPAGTWTIRTIDINPDWTSTRGLGYVPPGPEVPLGRVRMRYDGVYALHGTNNPDSIGTYATLGCVRMFNEEIINLTELILKDTGTWKGDEWFNNMLDNPTKMYRIPLRETVTITIKDL